MKYVCGFLCLLALAAGLGALASGMTPSIEEGARAAQQRAEIQQMLP